MSFELVPGDSWHPLDGVQAPEYIPEKWDGPHAGKRLVEAFATLAQIPWHWGPAGYGRPWPEYSHDVADLNCQQQGDHWLLKLRTEQRNRVRLPPSANEITRMETAIAWPLRYLAADPYVSMVVLLVAADKARGLDMRDIAERVRMQPATLRRRNGSGLDLIAGGLRREGVSVF